jgi:hypothetical protein
MKIFRNILFIGILFLLPSWGWVGHQIISSSVEQVFTGEIAQFTDWVQFLTDHASDADYRKSDDPTEGPKHYIDIDNYPEYFASGRIPQTLDSCLEAHGEAFVEKNGYLPWATLDTYELLVESMKNFEWEEAQMAAADLGHYVADGFMPFHITRNYNGQFSDNDGIHFRYESDMVNAYKSEIILDVDPFELIEDPAGYVFNYLYSNYQYVETLLAADNEARAQGEYNAAYYEALWDLTGELTIELFSGASHALASLIYTAWVEAGKPDLNDDGSTTGLHPLSAERFRVWPNPFSHSTQIALETGSRDRMHVQLLNTYGKVERVVFDGEMDAGTHRLNLSADSLSSGVYFLVFRNSEGLVVKRIVKE